MGSVIGWFMMVLGVITLLAIILAGLSIYGYSKLVITIKSVRVVPEFKIKPSTVIGSLFSIVTRNFVSAAGGLLNGIRLNGQILCLNRSFVPLYFPDIEHYITIGGKRCIDSVHTHALWLWPGSRKIVPVSATLGTNDIPQIALSGLTHKGAIKVEIQSKVSFGPFSYSKITRMITNIPNPFSKAPKDNKKILYKNTY